MILNLSWNYDKILSDPLTSGKLYYRKPFVNDPILVGTVNDIAPVFNVAHQWSEGSGGNGLADIVSNITAYAKNLTKSLDKFITGSKASITGEGKTSKASNIVTNDLNNKFMQYNGTDYQITLPQLIITLLPTDDPTKSDISSSQTPAGKLLRLMSYQAGQSSSSKLSEGTQYSEEDKVGPSTTGIQNTESSSGSSSSTATSSEDSFIAGLSKVFSTIGNSVINAGSHPYNELKKLTDTKLIGSSAYIRNQILSIAPFDFVRSYDTAYPVYLQGTVSLVINGVIYKNLLVSEINTECSKTRIINEGQDYGPSWIKCTLSFVPAIGWTVRDLEDILLQLSNAQGYSAFHSNSLY